MQLYNTHSQQLEDFEFPAEWTTVYVCGITPYDTTHLGHAFTYAVADILVRWLEQQGHSVKYVQNVTDIDDDILRKAKEVNEDWQALGNRWTAHFIRDMQALNVRPPDEYPRATDVIPQIIDLVQALIKAEVAYVVDGNVYFSVASWPRYGQLSHLPHAEMLPVANEHGNQPDDPHKRNPLDFVLWQAQAPGEPNWASPWGAGRPGWHIECSAMATHFLGETIDIHSGGSDLVFPHHESEIAQTEAVTQREPFARCWLHTAMVRYEGEKMSKSLGNLVMVTDLLKTYSADSLRLYLGQHHYRTAWSYREAELVQAEHLAQKLRAAVLASGGAGPQLDASPSQHAFKLALDQDLDTPKALAVLENLADQILLGAQNNQGIAQAQQALRAAAQIFGLRLGATQAEPTVMAGWQRHLARFTDSA